MGILGSLKDKVLHRNEDDFDDFRSHILGQEPLPETEPAPPRKLYEREQPAQANSELAPFGFDEPEPAAPKTQEVSRNYEMMDRLEMIEAQLSAIRSQTETINERLKNLEMKLTARRY